MSQSQVDVLQQGFEVGFTYTRTTGPVVGRFLTELKKKRIVGIRGVDGRVLMPPVEYDPVTADSLSEFVELGQEGEVTTWCWVHHPREKHPLQRPFAWALIRLDGADTPFLHAVDAGSESAMKTGMRVGARWADERTGFIADLACFEPV